MNNDIDLDKFLLQQRQRLEIEEKRLLQKRDLHNKNSIKTLLQGFEKEAAADDDVDNNENYKNENNDNENNNNKILYDITDVLNVNRLLDLEKKRTEEKKKLDKNVVETDADGGKKCVNRKDDKQQEKSKKNKDDMEQWVTDTFYSYFPGFNNEYQTRQNHLRDRQRQNQENFLKHRSKDIRATKKKHLSSDDVINTARSTASTTSSTTLSHTNDKTDLEIIVNNPDYVSNAKTTPRSRPTRQKLLQDLRHIELSKMIAGDGINERNLQNAEVATERKKNYQRDLMHQIEEKRRSIEQLREKERKQEHLMTRRLEQQLKAIKLQEQIEKEKLAEKKLRFDIEKNRMIRANLLTKLETPCLETEKIATKKQQDAVANSTKSSSSSDLDYNKVYKYFSNSAQHEFRRGQRLAGAAAAADREWSIDLPKFKENERECFHLSNKICPNCNEPLKKYEFCCLRCQKSLSLKSFVVCTASEFDRKNNDVANNENVEIDVNGSEKGAEKAEGDGVAAKAPCDDDALNDMLSFSLVCINCNRLYLLCKTCLSKSDVCRACHRKRNVCMNCRRSLCSFCLEEVAKGKDVEFRHINEEEDKDVKSNDNMPADTAQAFKVLEIVNTPSKKNNNNNTNHVVNSNNNNGNDDDDDDYNNNHNNDAAFLNAMPVKQKSDIQLIDDTIKNLPKIINSSIVYDLNNSNNKIHDLSDDILQHETNDRVSRYVTNYADIVLRSRRDRSTQTLTHSAGRRDIVIREDQNLSMPLLREMPKMTRKESDTIEKDNLKNKKIENLAQRWEIPAVQKHSVSVKGPKVLTQIGAFRKQLQTERLLEYPTSDD